MKLKETLKRPAVIWTGLTIILIVGALLVPMDVVRSFGDILGEPETRTDAFSDEAARIDEALAQGNYDAVDPADIRPLLADIQVRRLLKTGPMTAEEVRRATELMAEFNTEIASQELEGSRDALRAERNRRLVERFPRLDPAKIDAQLAELRAQLERAGWQPTS